MSRRWPTLEDERCCLGEIGRSWACPKRVPVWDAGGGLPRWSLFVGMRAKGKNGPKVREYGGNGDGSGVS